MLPSFVIGLREGLEAALIVGIIAAFLRKQGRGDLLRAVLIGVGIAIALCLGAGILLRLYSQNLPQKQQEGLETIIALVAVGMVTYMVVWMRRNSRNLKGQLEGLAKEAMAGSTNAGRAMVAMAFLAVIREGLETVVFLLAAFNESDSGATAGVGATLGIVIAIGLGYGIYRGGVRLNLSKFFRATGFVLVLVAAGLVVNAFHTAHEAGWVDFGQQRTVDLTWLVEPGTVQASLLTGMLGLQPRPVLVELVGWLVYLIPVGLYVTWPPGRPAPTKLAVRGGVIAGSLLAVAAVVFAVVAPSKPDQRPTLAVDRVTTASVAERSATAVVVNQTVRTASNPDGVSTPLRARSAGTERHNGIQSAKYESTSTGRADGAGPDSLSVERVAELNGARPPIGIRSTNGRIPVRYESVVSTTVWLDSRTDRILDLVRIRKVEVIAGTASNNARLSDPVDTTRERPTADGRAEAVDAARADHDALDHRSLLTALAVWCGVLAAVAFLVALGFFAASRRRDVDRVPETEPKAELVKR